MIEFIVLAAIAVFIGWRLYITLGEDNGPPDGQTRQPPTPIRPAGEAPKPGNGDVVSLRPNFTGPNAAGLEAIYEADNSFDPRIFMQGARAAYEMIVGAFARGDRDALKPMLDTDVYEAWDAVITEREKTGEQGMELLRIRKAELSEASLDNDGMARITVEFAAELGDGEHIARSDEFWTFMRKADSDDPNWLLDDVDTAD
jgi:predicted lipid-binding transport protein (Tim44 family)